jgi:SAM-dependent methyltransferase
MSIRNVVKTITPEPVKKVFRRINSWSMNSGLIPVTKSNSELSFWKAKYDKEGGTLKNSHYEKILLGMAGEASDEFMRGKIVADFGCGPRGSLAWAKAAQLRIGIDVLAGSYVDEIADNVTAHQMIYLKSTEKVIPLPSEFVDVLFTLNAIDHVDNFSTMCNEIIRVMKPGGLFIGSFNLEEPASSCEPQQLNEQIIKENLLDKLEIQTYRITVKGSDDYIFSPFFDGNLSYEQGQEGLLWVRAIKAG